MSRGRAVGAAILGMVGGWLLVGGWPGLIAGTLLGAVPLVAAGLSRRQHAEAADPTDPGAYQVAVHLSACLAAGASVVEALDAVAGARNGPMGERLQRVRLALVLGIPGDLAWQPMRGDPGLARIADAVAGATESGLSVSVVLSGVADDLNARRHAELIRRARVAPLRVLGPLGVCFLPAFVLVGILPVVVGLARSMIAVR